MRIAQIGPPPERVPPVPYGGTKRVLWTLTEKLVCRRHDVALFATGDSLTSARLALRGACPLAEGNCSRLVAVVGHHGRQAANRLEGMRKNRHDREQSRTGLV